MSWWFEYSPDCEKASLPCQRKWPVTHQQAFIVEQLPIVNVYEATYRYILVVFLKHNKPDCRPYIIQPWLESGLCSAVLRTRLAQENQSIAWSASAHFRSISRSVALKHNSSQIHTWNKNYRRRTYLPDVCYRDPFLNKSISDPSTNIRKNSHCQPWQDTEKPGLG